MRQELMMTPITGSFPIREQTETVFEDIFKESFYFEYTYLGEPTMAAATKAKVKAKKKKRASIIGGLAKSIQKKVKPNPLLYVRYIGCDYMQPVLQHTALPHVVDSMVKAMKDVEFEGIAFRGFSGAILAGAIAARTYKPLILIRKGPGADGTHSGYTVEGAKVATYVIVDDLISSGKTVNSIIDEMTTFCDAKCKGIFLYKSDDYIKTHTRKNGEVVQIWNVTDWTKNAAVHY